MLTLFSNWHISAKWRLLSRRSSAESQWACPKRIWPLLLLSPNKSGAFSMCGQALVPASCSADGWAWAVWWIAYIRWRLDQWRRVDWLAQRGRGGKYFLCVLMDGPAEALWLLVAGWWLLLPPFLSLSTSSPPSSFAFTLTVNQRRVNWDEPGFQSRKAAF